MTARVGVHYKEARMCPPAFSNCRTCGSGWDEERHGFTMRVALLFLFGWSDSEPAQLLGDVRARGAGLHAEDHVGKLLLVAALHSVELAFDLVQVLRRARDYR